MTLFTDVVTLGLPLVILVIWIVVIVKDKPLK